MAKVESNSVSEKAASKQLEMVIRRLGLDDDNGLVRSWEEFGADTSRHVVRQAFSTIGVSAVFGFYPGGVEQGNSFSPVLYFCCAETSEAAKEIHRLVWSQGVVPLLLIATPSALEIRRSLAPPPETPIAVGWEEFEASPTVLPPELNSLSGIALRSSIVWRDFAIDRSARIDTALLDGIVQLSDEIAKLEPSLDRSTVHSIIGRFLYLYVLLDRNVIDHRWIESIETNKGVQRCPSIASSIAQQEDTYSVWPANEVWSLFDAIDEVLNGAIFPISQKDRANVDEKILHLIHRVIRHGDRIHQGARQLSFLDVSFSTLRTETISAIYELFLALESGDQKSDDGAFYTPPYLVDYVLDEMDRISAFNKKSRVLDPAAGSGIFLVGAFRRILERSLPKGKWAKRHLQTSRKLLENNIFGIERNPQAANVCRFSLYLTILDYFKDASITELKKMSGDEKVFPPLLDNVQSRDVFEVDVSKSSFSKRFSHVVGNPPWGTIGESATRTNVKHSERRSERFKEAIGPAAQFYDNLDKNDFPVSNKRLSELFIWKIRQDFLAKNGAMGILISTRSFVGRSSLAFPNAFAKQFKVIGIANLSHFRYRLFSAARSPTIALFAVNSEPDPMDEVWVYSPLLSSQPIGEKGHLWSIIVNSVDVEVHRNRDLVRSPEGWFDNLILRPLDRRYAKHIRAWTDYTKQSIGGVLSKTGFVMSRGGSPSQTGLPDELLLKADYKQVLGLDGLSIDAYPHSELKKYKIPNQFARLFGGNILLIPRSMNDAHFVEEPIGFSSTFNAVYYKEKAGIAEKKLLSALAKYLVSDVARYFFALIGKTWILDHARLEKKDMQAVPFPIEGEADSGIDVLLSDDQQKITEFIQKRIGLDKSFCDTVSEYTRFRSGFEDSQVPAGSLKSPSQIELRKYQTVLKANLLEIFGSQVDAEIEILNESKENYFAHISVLIQRKGEETISHTSRALITVVKPEQFSPHTSIGYDPKSNHISIFKPWTHVAWTIEQAFTDARAISSEILKSGVSA
jgi:hypothetical protein